MSYGADSLGLCNCVIVIERTSTTTSVDWDCVIVIERTSTTTSKDQKSKTGRPKISIKSGLVRNSRIKKVYSQGKNHT